MRIRNQDLLTQAENVMHREELKRQIAQLKAHRDELLINYIKLHPELDYQRIGKQQAIS